MDSVAKERVLFCKKNMFIKPYLSKRKSWRFYLNQQTIILIPCTIKMDSLFITHYPSQQGSN